MFGVAFSSFAGGLLTDLFGFRGAMWLTTAIIGAAAVLWLLALPETRPVEPPHNPDPLTNSNTTSGIPWKFTFTAGLSVFVSRFVGWGVLAATMILWLEGYLGNGIRFGELYIPLATLTGGLTAVTMLVSMVGAPAAGRISDKLGQRWGVLAGSVLLGGIGMWLMGERWFGLGLLGVGLVQFCGGSVEALIPALTGDRIDKVSRGRTLGIIYTFGDLGSTLAPPTALGLLEAEILSLPQIYHLGAGLLALVAGVAWLQSRR
jgi:MFS family permease